MASWIFQGQLGRSGEAALGSSAPPDAVGLGIDGRRGDPNVQTWKKVTIGHVGGWFFKYLLLHRNIFAFHTWVNRRFCIQISLISLVIGQWSVYNVYVLSLTARCPRAAGLHSRRPTLTASSQGVARPRIMDLSSLTSFQRFLVGCFGMLPNKRTERKETSGIHRERFLVRWSQRFNCRLVFC